MWRTALAILALTCAASSLPLDEFYPFGSDNGDSTLIPGKLQSFLLKQPLSVFGKNRRYVTLFPNGWLSLKASNISRTEAGIHPYYSINTKTHNTPVVYFRETFDSLLLKRVSSMFQATFPDISDNSFTSLFIATWHEPGALATSTSFQCVIAANKTATYSAFLFGGVYQSWGEGDGEKRVGFSSETQDNSYFVPSYFIDGIVPIDSTSNTDTPGLWSFRIDAENVILPAYDHSERYRRDLDFNVTSGDGGMIHDITIVFEQPLYSVMEAVGEVAVCFVTSTTAPIFSVDLSVSVAAGGDAEAVSDYDAGFVGDITVSTTGTRCINIDIIPDAFFECREEFTVILQVLDMPNVECSTVIAIIDDGLEGTNYQPFVLMDEDNCIAAGEDSSEEIFFFPPVSVGTTEFTSVKVGKNGVIFFGSDEFNSPPTQFPGTGVVQNAFVVAPYWNLNDIDSAESSVCYRVFDQFNFIPSEFVILDAVSDFIAVRENQTNFSGQWMLVAKWNNVHPTPFDNSDSLTPEQQALLNRTNTFEAIVISDRVLTYTIFSYECNFIRWASDYELPGSRNAVIGFNAEGESFENFLPLSGTVDVKDVDCPSVIAECTLPVTNQPLTNIIYEIGRDVPATSTLTTSFANSQSQLTTSFANSRPPLPTSSAASANLCLNFRRNDFFTFLSTPLPFDALSSFDCPCSSNQADIDLRYTPVGAMGGPDCYARLADIVVINFFPGILCCYSNSGTIITFGQVPFRSSFSVFTVSSIPPNGLVQNIISPDEYEFRINCCDEDVGLCDGIHASQRPQRLCREYRPPIPAWGWGDPHIQTFDTRGYTFNGLGEYILARVNITSLGEFLFQGRTVLSDNSNATQFSAFAFGIKERSITAEIRQVGSNQMTVILNGVDVTANLTTINDEVSAVENPAVFPSPGVTISRTGASQFAVVFDCGITFTVEINTGEMIFAVVIFPVELQGQTVGLLGNFNENDDDDYVFQNGTMISNSSSDSEIHEFGQSWQITANESLFTYENGESVNTFSDPGHIPPFLDDILLDSNLTLFTTCMNSAECVFDTMQTGNISIGLATLETHSVTLATAEVLGNNPPFIQAPAVFLVTIGQLSQYFFNVTDDDSFDVSPIGNLPPNLTLVDTMTDGIFIFEVNLDGISTSFSFEISAIDSQNAATVFNPQVQICACENGGSCTTNGLLNIVLDPLILACTCSSGFDGDFCELDEDGCLDSSCDFRVNCTDVAAPGTGAICGPCPVGFVGDGMFCTDEDECSLNICNQECMNTEGSFECQCLSGYRLNTTSPTQCIDINECAETMPCHMDCNNTDGSFECGCDDGFELQSDNISCRAVNACLPLNSCSDLCTRINGIDICTCDPGREFCEDSNTTCQDINECLNGGPCEQICTNSEGSFNCSCNDGFLPVPNDPVSCDDVDECTNNPSICTVVNSMCMNTEGSYECICIAGTVLVDGSCQVARASFTNTSAVSVTEDSGAVTLCIQVIGGVSSTNRVSLMIITSSFLFTSTPNVDYIALAADTADELEIVFEVSGEEQCVQIAILNDNKVETNEDFDVKLLPGFSGDNLVVASASDTVTVTITDSSVVTVGFQFPFYSVTEETGSVTVCVELSGELDRSVRVTLSTVAGSAQENIDYLPVNGEELVFGSSLMMCRGINISVDNRVENKEQFTVTLQSTDTAVQFSSNISTVFIIDSSNAFVTISRASYSVLEGSTASVSIDLTGVLDRSISLAFATENITAQAGDDFIDASEDLLLSDSMTVNINTLPDRVLEPSELFSLHLTSIDPAVIVMRKFAYVEIEDATIAEVDLTIPSMVFEADAVINATITLGPADVSRDVFVFVTTADNSTQGITDYIPMNCLLRISQGQTSVDFSIIIVSDGILEDEESFLVTLLTEEGSNVTETVTIIDSSRADVVFGLENYLVIEGDNVTICLELSTKAQRAVGPFALSPVFDSADAADFDFPLFNFTFMPGVTEVCFDITTVDDSVFEQTESITLEFDLTMTDPSVDYGMPTVITVLDDGDNITDQCSDNANCSMNEACINTPVGFACVCNSGLFSFNNICEDIDECTVNGICGENADCFNTFGSYQCTCSSGFTRISDLCEDIDECLQPNTCQQNCTNIAGSFACSCNDNFSLIPNDTSMCINDVTISLLEPQFEVDETQLFAEVCVIVSGVQGYITVHIETMNGSAIAGEDFQSLSQDLIFHIPGATMCVNITIIDDSFIELDESFSVQLSVDALMINAIIDIDTEIITIRSEDALMVSLVRTDFEISESDADNSLAVQVCVSAEGEIQLPFPGDGMVNPMMDGMSIGGIPVTLRTRNVTAEAPEDYPEAEETLFFSEGNTTRCACFAITDDNILETDESFAVNLDSSVGPCAIMGSDTAIITIVDEDRVTIGFAMSNYSSMESDGSITVEVQLDGEIAPDRVVEVTLMTMDGTAIANVDYSPLSVLLSSFPTNVTINITNDTMVDFPIHTFFVTLNTSDDRVDLQPDTAQIDIIDDEAPLANFSQSVYNIGEDDGFVTVCIQVVPALLVDSVDITLSTMDCGTAIVDTDYTTLTETVEFTAGTSQMCRNITILSDADILDGPKNFCIMIASNASDSDVIIMQQSQMAEVIISDADLVDISFVEQFFVLSEESNPEGICVAALSRTILEMSIDLIVTVVNGTAEEGLDFVIGDQILQISEDSRVDCLPLSILMDNVDESTESFILLVRAINLVDNVISSNDELTIYIDFDGPIADPCLPRTISLNNCSQNASCIHNLMDPGTFTCLCNSGLTGDGVTCEELPADIVYINDTPMVFNTNDSYFVRLTFTSNIVVESVMCQVDGFAAVDCTNGSVVLSLNPTRPNSAPVTLTITTFMGVISEVTRYVHSGATTRCDMHETNDAVAVNGTSATFSWQVTGSLSITVCEFDGDGNPLSCFTGYTLDNLSSGMHHLRVTHVGDCPGRAIPLNFNFSI